MYNALPILITATLLLLGGSSCRGEEISGPSVDLTHRAFADAVSISLTGDFASGAGVTIAHTTFDKQLTIAADASTSLLPTIVIEHSVFYGVIDMTKGVISQLRLLNVTYAATFNNHPALRFANDPAQPSDVRFVAVDFVGRNFMSFTGSYGHALFDGCISRRFLSVKGEVDHSVLTLRNITLLDEALSIGRRLRNSSLIVEQCNAAMRLVDAEMDSAYDGSQLILRDNIHNYTGTSLYTYAHFMLHQFIDNTTTVAAYNNVLLAPNAHVTFLLVEPRTRITVVPPLHFDLFNNTHMVEPFHTGRLGALYRIVAPMNATSAALTLSRLNAPTSRCELTTEASVARGSSGMHAHGGAVGEVQVTGWSSSAECEGPGSDTAQDISLSEFEAKLVVLTSFFCVRRLRVDHSAFGQFQVRDTTFVSSSCSTVSSCTFSAQVEESSIYFVRAQFLANSSLVVAENTINRTSLLGRHFGLTIADSTVNRSRVFFAGNNVTLRNNDYSPNNNIAAVHFTQESQSLGSVIGMTGNHVLLSSSGGGRAFFSVVSGVIDETTIVTLQPNEVTSGTPERWSYVNVASNLACVTATRMLNGLSATGGDVIARYLRIPTDAVCEFVDITASVINFELATGQACSTASGFRLSRVTATTEASVAHSQCHPLLHIRQAQIRSIVMQEREVAHSVPVSGCIRLLVEDSNFTVPMEWRSRQNKSATRDITVRRCHFVTLSFSSPGLSLDIGYTGAATIIIEDSTFVGAAGRTTGLRLGFGSDSLSGLNLIVQRNVFIATHWSVVLDSCASHELSRIQLLANQFLPALPGEQPQFIEAGAAALRFMCRFTAAGTVSIDGTDGQLVHPSTLYFVETGLALTLLLRNVNFPVAPMATAGAAPIAIGTIEAAMTVKAQCVMFQNDTAYGWDLADAFNQSTLSVARTDCDSCDANTDCTYLSTVCPRSEWRTSRPTGQLPCACDCDANSATAPGPHFPKPSCADALLAGSGSLIDGAGDDTPTVQLRSAAECSFVADDVHPRLRTPSQTFSTSVSTRRRRTWTGARTPSATNATMSPPMPPAEDEPAPPPQPTASSSTPVPTEPAQPPPPTPGATATVLPPVVPLSASSRVSSSVSPTVRVSPTLVVAGDERPLVDDAGRTPPDAGGLVSEIGVGETAGTAVVGVATASTMATTIAAPVSASRASRAGSVSKLARCLEGFESTDDVDEADDDEEPLRPSVFEWPFAVPVGSSPLRFLTGASLCIALIQCVASGVVVRYLVTETLPPAASAVILRAVLPLWSAYFLPTAAGLSISVLVAHKEHASPLDFAIAGLTLAVAGVALGSMALLTHRTAPRVLELIDPSNEQRKASIYERSTVRPPHGQCSFLAAFGPLLDGASRPAQSACRNYFVVEVGGAVALAALAETQPQSRMACWFVAGGLNAISLALLGYMIVVRPYRSKIESAFGVVLCALQVVVCAALTLAQVSPGLVVLGAYALLGLCIGFFAQAVIVAVWSLVLARRRSSTANSSDEPTGGPAGAALLGSVPQRAPDAVAGSTDAPLQSETNRGRRHAKNDRGQTDRPVINPLL